MMPPKTSPPTDIDPEVRDFIRFFAQNLVLELRDRENSGQSLESYKLWHRLLHALLRNPLVRHLSFSQVLLRKLGIYPSPYDIQQHQKLMGEMVSATVAAFEEIYQQSASVSSSHHTHLPSDTSQKII